MERFKYLLPFVVLVIFNINVVYSIGGNNVQNYTVSKNCWGPLKGVEKPQIGRNTQIQKPDQIWSKSNNNSPNIINKDNKSINANINTQQNSHYEPNEPIEKWLGFFFVLLILVLFIGYRFLQLFLPRISIRGLIKKQINRLILAYPIFSKINQAGYALKQELISEKAKQAKSAIFKIILTYKFFLILVIGLIFFYALLIYPEVKNNPPLPHDTYRDVSYIQNVLNGNSIFADQAIKDEFIWYPPLNPLIILGLSKITGLSIFTLYTRSVFFINFLIPILFYIFVALIFDHLRAFIATLLITIMPWLSSHIFKIGMTSIHGIAYALLALIIFIWMEKKGFTLFRSIIAGFFLGVSFLTHTFSAFIIYGGIFLTLFVGWLFFKKRYKVLHMGIILLLPVLLSLPYMGPNLFRKKLNALNIEYFSLDLLNPDFFLHFSNQYMCLFFILFAIVGLYVLRKKIKSTGVLLCYFLVFITLAGQITGYLHNFGNDPNSIFRFAKNFPILLPHEFQWYFQLYILVFISAGFFYFVNHLKLKKNPIIYLALLLLMVPGFIRTYKDNKPRYKNLCTYDPPAFVHWVRENTDKNAVFIVSNSYTNGYYLQPYTARKIIYSRHGYINYNVNADQRRTDRNHFLNRAKLPDIRRIVEKYDIEYFLMKKTKDLTPERMKFFKSIFPILYNDKKFAIFSVKLE